MKIGKLDNNLLEEIVLSRTGIRRPEVLVRPGVGEDCAVVGFGDRACVLSTDPITASAESIGTLAVHVSCNDIAARGVEPLGIMLTVLLPPETTEDDIRTIMSQAAAAAEELNVEIIGGHTEITDTVKRPVICATAIGSGGLRPPGEEPRPGDKIMVTKGLAMEGTGIIAMEREDELGDFLTSEEIVRAKSMLDEVSVVREGAAAGRAGFTAMHDITEGGVLGALWELCKLWSVGAVIDESLLPIDDVTRKICAHYDLDPLRLISSGSMMIFARPTQAESITDALQACESPVSVTVIGEVKPLPRGVLMEVCGEGGPKLVKVEPPGSDEIYKL